MTEPEVYKVTIIDTDMLSDVAMMQIIHSWIININSPPSTYDFIDQVLADNRVKRIDEAREELATDNREQHLLNVYMAWDKTTYHVSTTYVFSDRTTAMLFRLSH